ncbi:prostaglandin E synthase isoform X2 [Serinus canaria]|uniref:prostaglandin E synthase isoform X2 n=1 Tax=Serinus canaria TaxID=9135 RepID=UPI0021CC70DB|nr:prostaglandin E synthase isoform X2 [Serinus canaria]
MSPARGQGARNQGCSPIFSSWSARVFQAFANPEDALRNGGLQFCREDPDVERCRRAHRNDMENIFPFLFLGAIYSLLDPSPTVARIHFLIFCVGRIVHTIAYLLQLRAPTRSVAYSLAQLPCFSMALQILLATTPYWCFKPEDPSHL